MKHLICTLAIGVVLSAGVAEAADGLLARLISRQTLQGPALPPEPIPDPGVGAPPYAMPGVGGAYLPPDAVIGGPSAIYPRVVYRDRKNIAPCAVPTVVQAPDPCPNPCVRGPQCVSVEVCVPPCAVADVRVTRRGNKIKYDYGKYAVELTARNGAVVVDYDD